MKALTVRQPWASAIFHLGKDVENRSWHTKYRGPLAIHSASRDAPAPEWPECGRMFDADTRPRSVDFDAFCRSRIHQGAVIGVVNLVDCGWLIEVGNPWAMENLYRWKLVVLEVFDQPIPAKGGLGLWNWEPPEVNNPPD